MWMTKDQIGEFPKFARYVRHSMPDCASVHTIVKYLKKYAALSAEEITHALTWGTEPLVYVADLWDEIAWKPEANGRFYPAKPYQIDIAKHRVDQFEIGFGDTQRTASGRDVFVVGATILHELCHWGCFKNGVTEVGEHGKKFELAVYGRNIG